MSDTHKKKERSSSSSSSSISGGDSGGGGVVGGEDDGKNRRRRGFVRYKRHFTRVAQNVLAPFKKAKKHLCYPPRSRSRPRGINPPTPTNNNKKRWGCLCFAETPTLDSQTQTTDPNNPELFTYDTLKSLVEKNDFYSRECNPHI